MRKAIRRVCRLMLLALSLIIIAALTNGCGPARIKTATVSGTVIFPEGTSGLTFPIGRGLDASGNALSKGIGMATVYLDDRYVVTTDGRFSFADVPVGQHTLKVSDAFYSSEETVVNVTEKGVDDVTLRPDMGVLILMRENGEPAHYLLAAMPRLTFGDSDYQLVRISVKKGDNWVTLGTTEPDSPTVNLAEELDLGKNDFRCEVLDGDDVIRTFYRSMTVYDFKFTSGTPSTAKPTFTWTSIPNAAYSFYMEDEFYEHEESCDNFTTPSYTVKNDLVSGREYDADLSASVFDLAGHIYMMYIDEMEFTYAP